MSRNREMSQDHWNTIVAIKQHNFDEYWKRCNNSTYLTLGQKYGVISNLALEEFDKKDWRNFQECIDRNMQWSFSKKGVVFKKEKKLTMNQILDCYISAIVNMQMVYDV